MKMPDIEPITSWEITNMYRFSKLLWKFWDIITHHGYLKIDYFRREDKREVRGCWYLAQSPKLIIPDLTWVVLVLLIAQDLELVLLQARIEVDLVSSCFKQTKTTDYILDFSIACYLDFVAAATLWVGDEERFCRYCIRCCVIRSHLINCLVWVTQDGNKEVGHPLYFGKFSLRIFE